MAGSALQIGNDVASAMRSVNRAVVTSTKKGLRAVGVRAKKELEGSGRARVPSMRFRNMRGAKIGVRYKVTEDQVAVAPTGPWGILEPGATSHTISSPRAMPIGPRMIRRGPFHHPGTGDTGAWSKGREATYDAAEKILTDTVGAAAEEAFGG